jgi:hypothetical protein
MDGRGNANKRAFKRRPKIQVQKGNPSFQLTGKNSTPS